LFNLKLFIIINLFFQKTLKSLIIIYLFVYLYSLEKKKKKKKKRYLYKKKYDEKKDGKIIIKKIPSQFLIINYYII